MSPDFAAHASQLVRLERRLQRVQVLACGSAILTATLLLTGYDGNAVGIVQTERLELITAQGTRQAMLSADTLGFAVILLDGEGKPTGRLRLSAEPRVTVETGRGREVAGLGAPKVRNLTE